MNGITLNSLRPCVTAAERKEQKQVVDQRRRDIDYICDVCQVKCPRDHKSHHNKTKKHLLKTYLLKTYLKNPSKKKDPSNKQKVAEHLQAILPVLTSQENSDNGKADTK